jgi:hypothetical protein
LFFLCNKQSKASFVAPSFTTPSNQKPRKAKSASYTHLSYTTVFTTKSSFINKSNLNITNTSKSLCRILLKKKQTVPQDFLFYNNIFKKACQKI